MKQYLRLFYLNFEYGRLPRQLILFFYSFSLELFFFLSFLNASHLKPEALKQSQAMTHPLCTHNWVFVGKQFWKVTLGANSITVPMAKVPWWKKRFVNADISQRKRYLRILCNRDCIWPFVILAGQFTLFAHLVNCVGTWQTGY